MPKFHKPCPVPLAIKGAIGWDLDQMEREGFIEHVDHSEWAGPIVAVPKKDGSFCICRDYKVTVNQALAVDQYPLPKPEELSPHSPGARYLASWTFLRLTSNCSLMKSLLPMLPSIPTKAFIGSRGFHLGLPQLQPCSMFMFQGF